MITLILDSPSTTVEQALEIIVARDNISLEGVQICDLSRFFYVPIDRFFRAYYRHILIDELIRQEVPITVCGGGWDYVKETINPKNIKYLGPISFKSSFEYIADSKIVLNVMPLFKAGMHDRVLTTMINEAVCVTDYSKEFEGKFSSDSDIIVYDLNKIGELPERLNSMLKNNDI